MPITIESSGLDLSVFIADLFILFGGVVGVAVAIQFSFMVVLWGVKFLKRWS